MNNAALAGGRQKQRTLENLEMQVDDSPHQSPFHDSKNHRFLLGTLLAVVLLGISADYFTEKHIEHACVSLIHWVELHPVMGIFAVIVVYIWATVLFIPGIGALLLTPNESRLDPFSHIFFAFVDRSTPLFTIR